MTTPCCTRCHDQVGVAHVCQPPFRDQSRTQTLPYFWSQQLAIKGTTGPFRKLAVLLTQGRAGRRSRNFAILILLGVVIARALNRTLSSASCLLIVLGVESGVLASGAPGGVSGHLSGGRDGRGILAVILGLVLERGTVLALATFGSRTGEGDARC
ncbi:hypothetical protein PG994_008318 [Apiospora phragmitis]|uniref:Uncharacterized protein n=1 Tax=Apiospora phragmitis TaxID=2905665 RepID=A0ABR1USN8_9PEZI